jgi:hypothetical protein
LLIKKAWNATSPVQSLIMGRAMWSKHAILVLLMAESLSVLDRLVLKAPHMKRARVRHTKLVEKLLELAMQRT